MRLSTVLLAAVTGAALVRADDIPTVEITTPPGQMKYDRPIITAAPGSQLKLIFRNNDEMPHNIVFCRPLPDKNDRGMEVALDAWKLAEKGMELGWIPPAHPRIWAHSKLVEAHKSEELVLRIPEEAGIYPFVCTFPGHAQAMNGELRVAAAGPGFDALRFRFFMGDWNALPDFSKLKPHREGELPDKKLDIQLEGMSEHFGIVFEGTVTVKDGGKHQFHLASDDGARLSIDGKPLIEMDGIHPSSQVQGRPIDLTPGPHTVKVEYFEQSGQEELYLGWAGPKFTETALSKWIHPTRRDGADPGAPERNAGIPLVPKNGEALIYRNFIAGASPHGIAVGYPNGVNVCFDAGRFGVPLAWRGAFIDAKQHWSDRGGGETRPLGFGLVNLTGDRPGLAVLEKPDAPWPGGTKRAEGIKFLGYRLDAHRFPTFRYRMGDTLVVERIVPEGDYKTSDERFTRSLKFAHAPENLHVRVAGGPLRADGNGWVLDGRMRITVEGGTATLRGDGELIARPALADGAGELRLHMAWLNQ